ncbi:MAG: YraN family protein, partial [bacterium]|nr:YraN family protein [bacterium]
MAEQRACDFLKKRGYFIKERNYKLKTGEIDIIAGREDLLAFIEVKMRSDADESRPCERVTSQQQARIIRTAEAYVAWKKVKVPCRFDII